MMDELKNQLKLAIEERGIEWGKCQKVTFEANVDEDILSAVYIDHSRAEAHTYTLKRTRFGRESSADTIEKL